MTRVAVICAVPLPGTVAGDGTTLIWTLHPICTGVEAVWLESLTEVAAIVTDCVGARPDGAVYVVATPLVVVVGETVPQGDVPQLTDQVTPLLAASFPTVAVTCTLALGGRVL